MKQKLLILFLLFQTVSFGQGFGEYITQYAIPFIDTRHLNDTIYHEIKDKQIIMVGEIHGTKESAEFVESLAKLISKKEGKVLVGIEIWSEIMNGIDTLNVEASVNQTVFFSRENTDGRNGIAWRDLVTHCLEDSLIDLFFFDNSNEYRFMGFERDSAMYLSVLEQFIKDPSRKIITLSGNVHNMLVPMGEMKTMGTYIVNDTLNFTKNSICSVQHVYSEGTMLNNTGNGLELKNIEFEESLYSKSHSSSNYFITYTAVQPSPYNGLFYTRKINHSPVIEPDQLRIDQR